MRHFALPTTTAALQELFLEYKHVGCFADSKTDRVLGHLMKSPLMTSAVSGSLRVRGLATPAVSHSRVTNGILTVVVDAP